MLIGPASRPTATLRGPDASTEPVDEGRGAGGVVDWRRYSHNDVPQPAAVSATTNAHNHQGPPPVARFTTTARPVLTAAPSTAGAITGASARQLELMLSPRFRAESCHGTVGLAPTAHAGADLGSVVHALLRPTVSW
ncbi:hypothetical protein [Nocardia beijingensis]|uniref:hypothetical protein n=1 Tax=Nocardia beijingensis TaxID=95162 RepID=UPI001E347035|nr:hypothetical protein [Nocardia beijingensis]